MKALLIKDFYMLKKYCRTLIVVMCIFPFFTLSNEESNFFDLYPVILAGMLAPTTLSYDERFKWLNFCDGTPISRSKIVSEKYLLSLLLSLLVLMVMIIVNLIKAFKGSLDMDALLGTVSLFSAFALMSPALMLPAFFKLGVEKGRMIYYVGFGLLFAVAFALPENISSGLILSGPAAIAAPPLLAALLFAISWLLSIRFYKNREL